MVGVSPWHRRQKPVSVEVTSVARSNVFCGFDTRPRHNKINHLRDRSDFRDFSRRDSESL